MDSPKDATPDPLIGRQVRDLRILERIGHGGMGAVYKAEHLLLREVRALKIIRAERFHSVPQALERFQREARIAVRLRHPNLVLIYDFFIEEGDQFLVMEYVVGESLAARIRERGALSVDETCSIGIQCCAGLAHAHDMGIVHRDLSPENILLPAGRDGLQVKIIDFGIARAAVTQSGIAREDAEATLTRVGDFLGKPRYASPEQAGKLRRGETLDARSDLYSLGLILYEMVTGDLPFHSDTEIGYLSLHAFQPPARPTLLRPDLPIPPALEQVILRCLEKDRVRRFAGAQALAVALEWAWHSGDPRLAPFPLGDATGPIETRSFGPVPDTAPWHEDGPAPQAKEDVDTEGTGSGPWLFLALALVLGIVAGIAVYFWTGGPEGAAKAPAGLVAKAPVAAEPSAPAPHAAPPPTAQLPPATHPTLAPSAGAAESAPLPSPRKDTGPQLAEVPARAAAIPQGASPVSPPSIPPSPRPPAPMQAPARAAPTAPGPSSHPFADPAEMRLAFDEAARFEQSHDATAAIANWKRFRSRGPSSELDEKAKRRITRLTLAGLQDVR